MKATENLVLTKIHFLPQPKKIQDIKLDLGESSSDFAIQRYQKGGLTETQRQRPAITYIVLDRA